MNKNIPTIIYIGDTTYMRDPAWATTHWFSWSEMAGVFIPRADDVNMEAAYHAGLAVGMEKIERLRDVLIESCDTMDGPGRWCAVCHHVWLVMSQPVHNYGCALAAGLAQAVAQAVGR